MAVCRLILLLGLVFVFGAPAEAAELGFLANGDAQRGDEPAVAIGHAEPEAETSLGSRQLSLYLGVARLGGYDGLGERLLSGVHFPGSDGVPGEVSVEPAAQFDAGVLVDVSERLTLDAGFQFGTAEASSDPPQDAQANVYTVGGRLALRLYPLRQVRLRPWISAGIQGLALVPREVAARGKDGRVEIVEPPNRTDSDLALGLGMDWPLGSRSTVTFGGDYRFGDTGWRLGIGWRFNLWDLDEPPRRGRLDLDVDTDRNRTVDDAEDDSQEDSFSPQRGAVLLVNLDDDDRRETSDGNPEDRQVRSRPDAEDLADLHFRHRPGTLEFARSVALRMTQETADSRARLFRAGVEVLGPGSGVVRDGYKEYPLPEAFGVEGTTRFSVEGIADGTKLGAADGNFGGSVTVELVERQLLREPDFPEPPVAVLDRVHLQVAPWLALGNLDPALEVLVVAPDIADRLAQILPAIDPALSLRRISSGNEWIQDQIEIGFSNGPGSELHAVGHVGFGVDRRDLFAPGVGVFELAGAAPAERFGNLEVTPPLRALGRDWPLGRIYHGRNIHPRTREFLRAQRFQEPAELDTDWLLVGHVDELVAFIPNPARQPGEKPFKVLIASPREAFRLLEEAKAEGRGSEVLCPRSSHTVEGVLTSDRDRNMDDWQPRIDATLLQLISEFGLDPVADVIEVPVVFYPYPGYLRAVARFANMVNILSLNGHLVIPAPCSTIFENALLAKLEAIGFRPPTAPDPSVHFVDTYFHSLGEIHCLTNVRRAIPEPTWWTQE